MSIKKDTIQYVADLARISLTPKQQELFATQLNDILSYVDKLNKLNTDNIEPMSHAVSMGNVLREDKVKNSLNSSEVLSNAPDKKDTSFKVPKVIE